MNFFNEKSVINCIIINSTIRSTVQWVADVQAVFKGFDSADTGKMN